MKKILKKLSRLISILIGLNTLIGLVVGGWLFGSKNLHINYAFSFICIQFYISTIFIMYLRTFIFRLNLDLVESNYLHIENDKYFIFKYTLPIYFVIQVVSGFGFLIMIFR